MEKEWTEHPIPNRLVAITLFERGQKEYLLCTWNEVDGWRDANKNFYKDEQIQRWQYAGDLFNRMTEARREPAKKKKYRLAKGRRV